jgi:predicted AAA+ superfamily ATPase
VNFEDSRLAGAVLQDLNDLLDVFFEIYPENKSKKTWFFLDEIQMILNWEVFVRRLLDQENMYVFATGSSSKMISKEIATSLRGRSLTYRIFPFSFREFLAAMDIKSEKYLSGYEKAMTINSLNEYIVYGGYPETVMYPQERERMLKEIIEVTIYRDILERHKVKNSTVLRILFNALFNSKEFSIHKFYNFLKSQGIKISKNTLYTYFEYFCDSLIVYPLRRFSYSYKDIEGSIPKIYFADNGLMHSNGIKDNGRLMENLVFVELERQFNENLFYYKSIDDKEADFVVRDGKEIKQILQACYDLSDPATKEREIKGLLKASKDLKCDDLFVITWDYEAEEQFAGKKIAFIPLWKWLLGA